MKLKNKLVMVPPSRSDLVHGANLERYVIRLQKQIDMLYELADLGFEDGNPGLTHADCERIETLLAARAEVVEDE